MENIGLVRNLMLASLLVAPACVAGVDDDGQLDGNTDDDLGVVEASLSSQYCPAGTPAELAPSADQHLTFVLDATGVQKYSCNATATGAAWTFVAPEAGLFKDCHQYGIHYA